MCSGGSVSERHRVSKTSDTYRAFTAFGPRSVVTVVGGDAGDGVHVVFEGTDRLAAFVDSLPLEIKRVRGLG